MSPRPRWLQMKIEKERHGAGKYRRMLNQQAIHNGSNVELAPKKWKKRKHKTNPTEALFRIKAIRAGWRISKKGWPDFLCSKGDRVVAVEVKPDVGETELRKEQREVMSFLSSKGIACFRWSPTRGFQKYADKADLSLPD